MTFVNQFISLFATNLNICYYRMKKHSTKEITLELGMVVHAL